MISNEELLTLYQADRTERIDHPQVGTSQYVALRTRDRERRQRVAELIAAGQIITAADHFHAAWIFNHGETPDDAWQAHTLALRGAELGHRQSRWLSTASYDRWLMYQGKPQKYGTQFVSDGIRQRLWDVTPETTDEERAEWNVPPLAEQLLKAEEATRDHPEQPVITEDAPQWLKDALVRWGIPLGRRAQR